MSVPGSLYLSGQLNPNSDELNITIETFICLFVISYCDIDIITHIVQTHDICPCTVKRKNFKIKNIVPSNSLSNCVKVQEFDCSLPAVEIEEDKTVIAGLCSVLRWIIKSNIAILPNHRAKHLLGFRNGCLFACAESSVWTKFCEVQLPNDVRTFTIMRQTSQVPVHLAVLEAHLQGPVRTHNFLKRKLDIAKEVMQIEPKLNSNAEFEEANFTLYNDAKDSMVSKMEEVQRELQNMTITEKTDTFCLKHCYLEGIDLTLADMIVFPCVHYLLINLPRQTENSLRNVVQWYKRMFSDKHVQRAAEKCDLFPYDPSKLELTQTLVMPHVEQISLYKRDPSYKKLKCKHRSPDRILNILKENNIIPTYVSNYCSKLDWESLPSELHPAQGDLPTKRLERKCQQLESMVTAVLKLAKEGETIVEFCAGGGHVGLLLAYYLPKCKVVLVENKECSLSRAIDRAQNLQLKNVSFFQCNLGCLKGSFDLGVSLHACGVATDLVIEQCMRNRASFVCCPCCYGSIQETPGLKYPLSQKFTHLSYQDYSLLAHFADRTELNTPTAKQGEECMGFIDTDRAYYAQDHGYSVELSTLQPISCSPKHNLLLGVPNKIS